MRRHFMLGTVFSAALGLALTRSPPVSRPQVSRREQEQQQADGYSHWMFESG